MPIIWISTTLNYLNIILQPDKYDSYHYNFPCRAIGLSIGHQFYQDEPFVFQPGVYFEAREEVLISNDNWQLIIYSNISELIYNPQLNDDWQGLSTIACADIKNQDKVAYTICQNYERVIAPTLSKLSKKVKDLLELLGETDQPTRRKRGLANFVREASKFLFGTLDNDDAEY
jgi:hypothetical protein